MSDDKKPKTSLEAEIRAPVGEYPTDYQTFIPDSAMLPRDRRLDIVFRGLCRSIASYRESNGRDKLRTLPLGEVFDIFDTISSGTSEPAQDRFHHHYMDRLVSDLELKETLIRRNGVEAPPIGIGVRFAQILDAFVGYDITVLIREFRRLHHIPVYSSEISYTATMRGLDKLVCELSVQNGWVGQDWVEFRDKVSQGYDPGLCPARP